MSGILFAGMDPFWSAEMDYRLERAHRDYRKHSGRWRPERPRRRRGLKLPRPRRRPIAVA